MSSLWGNQLRLGEECARRQVFLAGGAALDMCKLQHTFTHSPKGLWCGTKRKISTYKQLGGKKTKQNSMQKWLRNHHEQPCYETLRKLNHILEQKTANLVLWSAGTQVIRAVSKSLAFRIQLHIVQCIMHIKKVFKKLKVYKYELCKCKSFWLQDTG